MNLAKDVQTEALLAESRRIRDQLSSVAVELDSYVAALQEYVERAHAMQDPPKETGHRD